MDLITLFLKMKISIERLQEIIQEEVTLYVKKQTKKKELQELRKKAKKNKGDSSDGK